VFTTPYYPPHIGGIEFHVQNIARRLAEKHEVEVVTSVGSDDLVRIIKPPCLMLPYSPIPLSFPEVEGDVYHSHIPSPFFAREIAVRGKRPHVITYHNDVVVPKYVGGYRVPFCVAKGAEYTNYKLTKDVLEKADAIIATTLSYARTSPLLSDLDIKVIPNGVNIDDFNPGIPAGERKRIVLYAGRIVEYKGLEVLIEAMKGVDAILVVVGDGEDRTKFQKLAVKSGVEAIFTGRVSEEEKIEWMRKARVLVLPSLNRLEAFGIALIEAMACATPVVASNLPGVRDVALEGGMVFEDVDDLREKINRILDDDTLATKLGKRGRMAARKYDWKRISEELEKLYLQLT
jgi:glycosyltransferase involved in cell wall biosynthesis